MLQWTLVPSFFFLSFYRQVSRRISRLPFTCQLAGTWEPGGRGAHATPRIWVLYSKNFQNGQNFIFFIIRAPLGKNRSQGPVNWM